MNFDNKKRISTFRFLLILLLLLMLPVLSVGCGYGKVSPRTYEIARGLYTICNLKQSEKLVAVSSLVKTSLEDKKITTRESGWLLEIIKLAKNAKWEEATKRSREIMEDQVK